MEWNREPCDLLLAMHARRSLASIRAFHERFPDRPLIIVLTGTDIYRDIRDDAGARNALSLATRLIVLQEQALAELTPVERRKTDVVYQSSATRITHAPSARHFRVCVLGHLREEKDPFRAVQALGCIADPRLQVVHIGDALSESMAVQARDWMAREARYRWLGGRSHGQALGWLARSHALVVSSRMEGGANVVCEAARIGVPVLASRISGNVGMLGPEYPGYYPFGDERALARLMERAMVDQDFFRGLRARMRKRSPLFAPSAERSALLKAIRHAHAG